MTADLERKLTHAVDRMPAFPRSVQKVLELTRNINCMPKELVAVIEKDPVMTVKILKVINSAYYSLPNKVTSVNQSVVYLGINTIKNLSLSFAAAGMLPRINVAGFDIQRYLTHSLSTAAVSRQLCAVYAKSEADPGDCYVAGLLHDFGKVVFAQFLATDFREVLLRGASCGSPLYQIEREMIGADHAYVGALLARKWQFPEHLVQCIGNHHDPAAPSSAMLDCLRIADQICRGIGPEPGEPPAWVGQSPVVSRFGDDMNTVVAGLGDLAKIIADATLLVQIDGGA
ncbi:MAG: HDOD domain-containing protein [Proteobacteria bacterium]|nr:HDOD domain-containing protein [Pseudomonadota bacterium]